MGLESARDTTRRGPLQWLLARGSCGLPRRHPSGAAAAQNSRGPFGLNPGLPPPRPRTGASRTTSSIPRHRPPAHSPQRVLNRINVRLPKGAAHTLSQRTTRCSTIGTPWRTKTRSDRALRAPGRASSHPPSRPVPRSSHEALHVARQRHRKSRPQVYLFEAGPHTAIVEAAIASARGKVRSHIPRHPPAQP